MIHDLKPYPKYKDSGVPWLGKVPEHWKVSRLGSSVTGCTNGIWGSDPNGKEDIICVRVADFDRIRMRVKINSPTLRAIPHSERNRKQLCKGDLLLEKSGGGDLQPVGVVILYDHDLPAVCSNFIARMPVKKSFEPAYLVYLHACLYSLRINVRSIKQTTGIQNLDSRAYLSEAAAFPPLSEQSAIVHYLDHIDRRIRHYIRAKKKLIKLLEEQKQAIIHQAVTRGLDPNVKLKPSGVEWLGDVPEHWEVMALRRVTLARCDGPFGSGLKSSHYTDQGIRVVRLTNIGHAEFRNSDAAFISLMHYASLGDHSVKADDVLIAGLGDEHHPAGRACIAPAEILPAMVKADCFRFRLKKDRINPKFAAIQLTATAVAASAILSTGATRQRINLQSTAGRMIAIPPLLEQERILDYIYENTSNLNIAIGRTHHEISLLREYRTRLIADVVTGKLDVKEAAANLSEKSYEMEVEDDFEEETIEESLEEVVTEEMVEGEA